MPPTGSLCLAVRACFEILGLECPGCDTPCGCWFDLLVGKLLFPLGWEVSCGGLDVVSLAPWALVGCGWGRLGGRAGNAMEGGGLRFLVGVGCLDAWATGSVERLCVTDGREVGSLVCAVGPSHEPTGLQRPAPFSKILTTSLAALSGMTGMLWSNLHSSRRHTPRQTERPQ